MPGRTGSGASAAMTDTVSNPPSCPPSDPAGFAVLGELLVFDGHRPVPVRAPKQRALLAALLLTPNRAVATGELVEILWDEVPPPNAFEALRTYVMRLRRTLGANLTRRLVTVPPGYLFEVADGEYDVELFRGAVDRGRQAMLEHDWSEALAAFAAGAARWRGLPYADVPSDHFSRVVTPRLVAERRQMTEWWAEVEMALGLDAEAALRLRAVREEDQFHEHTHELLIRALARDGQTAAALAVYRELRERLADNLGIDPGPALTRLQQQVLSRDPALLEPHVPVSAPPSGTGASALTASVLVTATPGRPTAARRPESVPRQLPAAMPLTGREAELRELLAGVRSREVTVVTGPGGIGKSALALVAAAGLEAGFADGCLFASLRGAGPAPRAAEDVLSRFLEDLGLSSEGDGLVLDDLTARWRAAVAGRAVLIVLDDAAESAQVRPLLPGNGPSRVLVTSRNRLSGLEDCHRVQLPPLPAREAAAMLSRIAGESRAAAEPAAVRRVITACGGYPLAIRAAAARLASRPLWSVTDLARRLDDTHRLLDELNVGDLAVRSGFQLSLDLLAEERSELDAGFALGALALCESPVVALAAVTAATGAPEAAVRRVLEQMVEVHLLDSPAPDAYTLHDLTRAYARDLIRRDSGGRFRETPERLVRWYLELAGRAARLITPARPHPELPPPVTISPPLEAQPGRAADGPGFADQEAAFAWLQAEIDGLSAAVELAFEYGLDEYSWRIPLELWEVFGRSQRWAQWCRALEAGLAAARRLADPVAESWLLSNLGAVCNQAGLTETAIRHLTLSTEIRHAQGNRVGEAAVLSNLAACHRELGRLDLAVETLEAATALLPEDESPYLSAVLLTNMAECLHMRGDTARALRSWREAAERFHACDAQDGRLTSVLSLAHALIGADRAAEAEAEAECALDLARRLRNRHDEAHALALLGLALLAVGGEEEQGRRYCAESVELFDRLGGAGTPLYAEAYRRATDAL